MRLFHFSDDPSIERFEPRSVQVPAPRPPGLDWLNGPLVWAIDEWHQPLYFFPRECPRILTWPGSATSAADRRLWWGERTCHMTAHIERAWLKRLRDATLFRYELPAEPFESLDDAGMFVARSRVEPIAVTRMDDLPAELHRSRVGIRVMRSLRPLRDVWTSSMRASGLRLRNARDWEDRPAVHDRRPLD